MSDDRSLALKEEDEARAREFFSQLRELCVKHRCHFYCGQAPLAVSFENKKRQYQTYETSGVAGPECGYSVAFRHAFNSYARIGEE